MQPSKNIMMMIDNVISDRVMEFHTPALTRLIGSHTSAPSYRAEQTDKPYYKSRRRVTIKRAAQQSKRVVFSGKSFKVTVEDK